MIRLVVLTIALAACADRSSSNVTPATLGDVEYAVPEGWTMRDVSQPGRTILEWTPASDNLRKQSIVIVRTPIPPMPQAHVTRLLGETLGQPARAIKTRLGLEATRVDGTFTPPNLRARYTRSHAVFADGDALVHVIYTAREPDYAVFDLVLEHVARKAG